VEELRGEVKEDRLLSSCLGGGLFRWQTAIEVLGEDASDAVAGIAVPERGDVARLIGSGKNPSNLALEFLKIVSNENVCTERYGNWPFGVLSHGKAWDAEASGLFLDAAGVGDDETGILLESKKVEVSDWIDESDTFGQAWVEDPDALARSWMNREDERQILRNIG